MKHVFLLSLLAVVLLAAGCKVKIPLAADPVNVTPEQEQIKLSWQRLEDAATYRLYRGTSPDQQLLDPVAIDVLEPYWTDHDVQKKITYYYKVVGVNRDGIEGPRSKETSAKLIKDPPFFKSEIRSSAGCRSVKLWWDRELNAVSYNIYRGLASGQIGKIPIKKGLTDTAWLDKNLVNGTTYYYRLTSVDDEGEESPLSLSEAKVTPFFTVKRDIYSKRQAKIPFEFSPAGKIKVCYTTASCSQTNYRYNSVGLTLTTAGGKIVASNFDSYPSSVTWGPVPDVVRVWRVPQKLSVGSYVLRIVVTEGDWQNDVSLVEILPVK